MRQRPKSKGIYSCSTKRIKAEKNFTNTTLIHNEVFFLKAVFEVTEVKRSWKSPLSGASVSRKNYSVEELQAFDETEKGEPLFRLLKLDGGKALIHYDRGYGLKGYSQPSNRRVWVELGEPTEFSSLWNENGVTKKLLLKGIE